jgi:hypothetical protein
MPAKVLISDPATGRKAAVSDGDELNALVVATRPLKTFDHLIRFFTNPDFGADLNVGVVIGDSAGAEDLLYDENAGSPGEWDTSAIVGGGAWDFASVVQANTGTVSIDATATTNNDTMQLLRSVALDLSDFVAISGQIYITGWSPVGKRVDITGWDSGTASAVGTTVDIGDYVDTTSLNVWQEFSIPLADMTLLGVTIDALRIMTIASGAGPAPNYYLDTLALSGAGGAGDSDSPETFTLEPDKDTWLYIHSLQFSLASDYDSTLTDGTIPNIPYDGLLGVSTLSRGLSYTRIQNGSTIFSISIRDFIDIMSLPQAKISGAGSDNINTWVSVTLDFTEPLTLKSEDLDRLSITVQDDLSGLLHFRVSAGCRVESRTGTRELEI